jgi:hypothetical protein
MKKNYSPNEQELCFFLKQQKKNAIEKCFFENIFFEKKFMEVKKIFS